MKTEAYEDNVQAFYRLAQLQSQLSNCQDENQRLLNRVD